MLLFTRIQFALVSTSLFALAGGALAAPTILIAQDPPPKVVEVTVYAATSTRDALQALEAPYEKEHKVDLVFNFGSSGDLSKQIVAAGKAEVFLSADEKEMDKVEEAKLVVAGTRRSLLSNQLVVIEPADGPSLFTTPFEPSQLANPKITRLLSLLLLVLLLVAVLLLLVLLVLLVLRRGRAVLLLVLLLRLLAFRLGRAGGGRRGPRPDDLVDHVPVGHVELTGGVLAE